MSDTKSKSRSRLGRGLASLISVSTEAEAPAAPAAPQADGIVPTADSSTDTTSDVSAPPSDNRQPTDKGSSRAPTIPQEIAVADVVPNPHQPRKTFDEASLDALGTSIRSTGLIQPIVVRPVGRGYELIAGERRWRAAQRAGLATMPALIRDVDAFTQAQMALVENIQREDLNPIERAAGYRQLMEQLGLTQAELAGRLGEDRSSIANFLRLLDLCVEVQAWIREGKLSAGHGKLLAGVVDADVQKRLAATCITQDLSVRNLERLIQQGGATPPPSKPTLPSAHIQDLEKTISRHLGMRVQLRSGSKGKGKLTIHYASLDQFDDLLAKFGVSPE